MDTQPPDPPTLHTHTEGTKHTAHYTPNPKSSTSENPQRSTNPDSAHKLYSSGPSTPTYTSSTPILSSASPDTPGKADTPYIDIRTPSQSHTQRQNQNNHDHGRSQKEMKGSIGVGVGSGIGIGVGVGVGTGGGIGVGVGSGMGNTRNKDVSSTDTHSSESVQGNELRQVNEDGRVRGLGIDKVDVYEGGATRNKGHGVADKEGQMEVDVDTHDVESDWPEVHVAGSSPVSMVRGDDQSESVEQNMSIPVDLATGNAVAETEGDKSEDEGQQGVVFPELSELETIRDRLKSLDTPKVGQGETPRDEVISMVSCSTRHIAYSTRERADGQVKSMLIPALGQIPFLLEQIETQRSTIATLQHQAHLASSISRLERYVT
jgi:hypothetical protein